MIPFKIAYKPMRKTVFAGLSLSIGIYFLVSCASTKSATKLETKTSTEPVLTEANLKYQACSERANKELGLRLANLPKDLSEITALAGFELKVVRIYKKRPKDFLKDGAPGVCEEHTQDIRRRPHSYPCPAGFSYQLPHEYLHEVGTRTPLKTLDFSQMLSPTLGSIGIAFPIDELKKTDWGWSGRLKKKYLEIYKNQDTGTEERIGLWNLSLEIRRVGNELYYVEWRDFDKKAMFPTSFALVSRNKESDDSTDVTPEIAARASDLSCD